MMMDSKSTTASRLNKAHGLKAEPRLAFTYKGDIG